MCQSSQEKPAQPERQKADWGWGRGEGLLMGMVSFRGDGNALKLIVVTVAQFCECIKKTIEIGELHGI